MIKVIILLSLLISSLFSNILCRQKISKELVLLEGGYPSWIVDKKHVLTFNPNLIKDQNFTKREPLLGLYLIELPISLKNGEKMLFRKIRTPYRFAIDDETYISGNVLKPQIGLDFAEFSEMIEDNIMITSGCCVTAGLSIGGTQFIDSAYIRNFIESENVYLADIGARFKEVDKKIIVDKVNPFFTDNPFLEGDEILYMNDESVERIDKFIQKIMFSPKDRILDFEILRDHQLLEVSVATSILRGGGFLSDTFLENIGVWFDESLYVANVHRESAFSKKGLKNNYKLISINGTHFETESDIRTFLSKQKAHIPDKFKFIFKLKDLELSIELKSNKKFYKNIKKDSGFGSFGNPSFSSFSTGTNMGTGNLTFGGQWNDKFKEELNNSDYDTYNSIPLAEYLGY